MTYQINGDDFGEIPIKTYRTNVNACPNTDGVANTIKLEFKFKAVYTYLFNSIDQRFKRHITHCVKTHHRMGPLADYRSFR